MLGPELDVVDARVLERLDDLLGQLVVLHGDEIDFLAHTPLLPSRSTDLHATKDGEERRPLGRP